MKEKQDRFDCKHLECCMDGCYCSAGHGSLRSYGSCVIPYEQETCAYFERKAKTKTVKITENEVVISKEEYVRLKNLEKFHIDNALIVEIVNSARKETARKIFKAIKSKNQYEYFSYDDDKYCVSSDSIEEIAKQYDVEIGDDE